MLSSSRRGVLAKGGRPVCQQLVARRLWRRTWGGNHHGIPSSLLSSPSFGAPDAAAFAVSATRGRRGDQRSRYISTKARGSAFPKPASITTTVAAVAGAAAAAAALVAEEADEESPKDAQRSTLLSTRSTTASTLLTRPTVSCAYRRRIQDMYRLVDSPVGQGAFGVVCAGVHKETGELVAVKQIPRKLTKPARLQAEVDLLRMAGQHRNVVNFRDLFSDDDGYYIVMEFATGGELFDRLVHKGAHSEHNAACLLREVTDAVAYLHGNNVVHFDLKPENILLNSSDSDSLDVRLVDFGSAFVVGSAGVGEPKANSGTVAYSAPEVLRGEPFGTAADMWSLGIVLYILLSGVHPFDLDGGASDAEVREKILEGEVSFEALVWSGKGAAIDLINRLLEVDPKRRPTAVEVLKHPWMEERAKLSRRPMTGAAENLRVFHRGRMQLKACLLAVMSGLAGGETYSDVRSTVGSRRQALRFMDVGRKDYISAGDLKRTLRLLGEDLSDEELLHMMQASTGQPGEETAPQISYNDFMKLVPPLCPSHVFKGGATIYSGGAMDRNFFLINEGEISLEVEGPAPRRPGESNEKVLSSPEPEDAGERVVVKLQTLGRGESFGEGELLAAAEAEEGSAVASAIAAAASSAKQRRSGRLPSESPVALLSGKDSGSGSGGGVGEGNNMSMSMRRDTPGEGPGRGAARGGGVPRATRAVCVSDMCEVMAVPRHLFANLLDELSGVRVKLERQSKARAATALTRLIEEELLDTRERTFSPSANIWPPLAVAQQDANSSCRGSDVTAEDATGVGGRGAGTGEGSNVRWLQERRASRREAASVLLVREGSIVVTQGGRTRRVAAGEVCVCGVPRRGIPPVTHVACSPGEAGATVVEIPLEPLRRGGLFPSPSLDAFLRVLSVGFYTSNASSDASSDTSAGKDAEASKSRRREGSGGGSEGGGGVQGGARVGDAPVGSPGAGVRQGEMVG